MHGALVRVLHCQQIANMVIWQLYKTGANTQLFFWTAYDKAPIQDLRGSPVQPFQQAPSSCR